MRAGVTQMSFDPDAVPLLPRGLTWNEQPVGFSFRTSTRTITESDLAWFVGLTGFTGPTFLDVRRAAASGYQGRVVPAVMTLALAEGLVIQTNVLHGTGIAFLSVEMDVAAPVHTGDSIGVVVEVIESHATSKLDRGLVRSRNSVYNQDATIVMTYSPLRLQRGKRDES